MDISVIIVNTRDEHELRKCVASLANSKTNAEWEVVIVNNGYKDTHQEIIAEFQDVSIHTINTKSNNGYGAACNQGARVAKGKILIFSNPDIVYWKTTLEDIVVHFEQYSNTGVVSPLLLLPPEDIVQPFSFGREVTPFRTITRKFLPTEQELLNRIAPTFTKTDWVAGAVLAMPALLFHEIEGFDEQFFLYFEDNDLCKRVQEHGKDVILLHWSPLHHTGHRGESGKTTRKENNKHKQLYYESQKKYFRKHYGLLSTAIVLIVQRLYRLGK